MAGRKTTDLDPIALSGLHDGILIAMVNLLESQLVNQDVKVTLGDLRDYIVDYLGGGAGVPIGIQAQEVDTDPDTVITPPSIGKIKLVTLAINADTQYTGLAAPTNTGKIYSLKLENDVEASFSVDIDGIPAGDVVLTGAKSRILIVDLGTYVSI